MRARMVGEEGAGFRFRAWALGGAVREFGEGGFGVVPSDPEGRTLGQAVEGREVVALGVLVQGAVGDEVRGGVPEVVADRGA
ncbi:hypothetical protein DBP18_17345 [Streptomyces sp. CS081A]|nr:hypothetical protein DBP18_17345 [Streptomyces sp. CS081A]